MIKTVSLTADTETKVEISGGYNVAVINRTTGMLYASRKSGISAGADDVAAIPAGDSYVIRAADDTVYLLATAAGDVQLESIGAKEVFKIAAARSSSSGGEGGTVDEVARQAIASHANNEDIHLTAEDAVEAAATAISNPNQLINPNFRINQRGQTEYTAQGYTVDNWKLMPNTRTDCKLTVEDDGVLISFTGDTTTANASFRQIFPNFSDYAGETVTISVDSDILSENSRLRLQFNRNNQWSEYVNFDETGRAIRTFTITMPDEITTDIQFAIMMGVTSNNTAVKIKLYSAKIEFGSVATPFIPPDPAAELAKCQRYYLRLGKEFSHIGSGYLVSAGNAAVVIPLPVTMRITPTVKLIGNMYINTAGATGNNALQSTVLSATSGGDNNVMCLFAIEGGAAGYGCTAQLRDADSYIELSAEL